MEAIHASHPEENHGGKRDGDEVGEVSDTPHQLGGQAHHDSCSPHWITSPAYAAAFAVAWTCRPAIGTDLHDEIACRYLLRLW
jgi:hypothetical protein